MCVYYLIINFNWVTLDTDQFYSTLLMRIKLICQSYLNLETKGKINLLVIFLERLVTQSKLSLIFTKTLLIPQKTTNFFWMTLMTYKKMQTYTISENWLFENKQ